MGNCVRTCYKATKGYTESSQGTTVAIGHHAGSHSDHPSPVSNPDSQPNAAIGIIAERSESAILASNTTLKAFTYYELSKATCGFHADNHIGEGGFGHVYKGWVDDEYSLEPTDQPGHGMVVAVKRLKPRTLQGHNEWLSEVVFLGMLRHPNLVRLMGYCLEGRERLLVYEYMPNGSLEDYLFKKYEEFPWAVRVKVAIDAAKGLSFLHDLEKPVIYRDFKASNILLDSDFNAKLSDFGSAKAGPSDARSHISTEIMGTNGYIAPEYMMSGRLTEECDVYSFGVLLLELLSGRRVIDGSRSSDEQSLVEWSKRYLMDKKSLPRFMDTRLGGKYFKDGATIVAYLAVQCVGEAETRPKMRDVLKRLQDFAAPPGVSGGSQQPSNGSSSRSPACGKSPSKGSPAPSYLLSPLTDSPRGRQEHGP